VQASRALAAIALSKDASALKRDLRKLPFVFFLLGMNVVGEETQDNYIATLLRMRSCKQAFALCDEYKYCTIMYYNVRYATKQERIALASYRQGQAIRSCSASPGIVCHAQLCNRHDLFGSLCVQDVLRTESETSLADEAGKSHSVQRAGLLRCRRIHAASRGLRRSI